MLRSGFTGFNLEIEDVLAAGHQQKSDIVPCATVWHRFILPSTCSGTSGVTTTSVIVSTVNVAVDSWGRQTLRPIVARENKEKALLD